MRISLVWLIYDMFRFGPFTSQAQC